MPTRVCVRSGVCVSVRERKGKVLSPARARFVYEERLLNSLDFTITRVMANATSPVTNPNMKIMSASVAGSVLTE